MKGGLAVSQEECGVITQFLIGIEHLGAPGLARERG